MEIRETAAGKHGQKLRESNIAFEAKGRQKVLESMRKEIKSMTGLDIMESAVQESGALDIFGADFSLKRFHDTLLRNGSLPISFHRRLLLGEG